MSNINEVNGLALGDHLAIPLTASWTPAYCFPVTPFLIIPDDEIIITEGIP
jgi:hypothetical protein